MIKNFDFPILDIKGEEIKEKGEPVIARDLIINALLMQSQDDNVDGTEKLKRFHLAEKVNVGGDVEICAEDVSLLKKLIGKIYGPLVVGRIVTVIEK